MTQAAPNPAPLPNSTYARATESFEAWSGRYGTLFSRNFARPIGGLSFLWQQIVGTILFDPLKAVG